MIQLTDRQKATIKTLFLAHGSTKLELNLIGILLDRGSCICGFTIACTSGPWKYITFEPRGNTVGCFNYTLDLDGLLKSKWLADALTRWANTSNRRIQEMQDHLQEVDALRAILLETQTKETNDYI